jgi:hypothetical protein
VHRLVYIVKNRKINTIRRALILPYAHERKIYLSAIRQGCLYFQTTKQSEDESGIKGTILISVNLTDYKYYFFNIKGILLKRFDFRHQVNQFGQPISVSNNGRIFIFSPEDKPNILNVLMITFNGFKFVKRLDIFT